MVAPVVHRFSRFLRSALSGHLQRPDVGLALADNGAGADRIMPFWPGSQDLALPAASLRMLGKGTYTKIAPRVVESSLADHRVHYGTLSASLQLDLWANDDDELSEMVGRVHWAFSESVGTAGHLRIPVPLYLDSKALYVLRDVQDWDEIKTAGRREYRVTIMLDGTIPRVRQYTSFTLATSVAIHIWAETDPDVFDKPFPGTLVKTLTP